MFSNNPKLEMQTLLNKCLSNRTFDLLTQGLSIYQNTFGKDSFYMEMSNSYLKEEPLLSLICLNVSDSQIEDFLSNQTYTNIEVVKVDATDYYEDLCEYFSTANSSYICFLEPGQYFKPNALVQMVKHLSNTKSEMVVVARNFINETNTIIAHPDDMYQHSLKDRIFWGKGFLELCLEEGVNLYGTLSTLMVSTSHAQSITWNLPHYEYDEIMKFALLSHFLLHGSFGYIDMPLVSTQVDNYRDESHLQECFYHYISELRQRGVISTTDNTLLPPTPLDYKAVKKHITFFYTDKGEYYNLKPIADEAARRGYTIEFTEDIKQKAEIGIYCQHVCFPENSKFSLILLHDMTQANSRWPNIWEKERWNKFDIGILPGQEWCNRWTESACFYYANPRIGTFCMGYPKSDTVLSDDTIHRTQELRQLLNFKYDFSVLYAPSWENDEKEDDFIRALQSLPVNLLIKQAPWSSTYPQVIDDIRQMRILHEGTYKNVYYIEPEENIMVALNLCDLVVSDESSVMTEAILYNKPSLAVIDWLIPDTNPKRFASVPMEYVTKCKKVELREYVERFFSDSTFYANAQSKFVEVFSNQGQCCNDILNAIDYYTQTGTDDSFMNKKLSPQYTPRSMWN